MSIPTDKNGSKVSIGDYMIFDGQDSHYEGKVVAVFQKLNESVDVSGLPPYTGHWRVVVQDDRRLLLIKNPAAGEVTWS